MFEFNKIQKKKLIKANLIFISCGMNLYKQTHNKTLINITNFLKIDLKFVYLAESGGVDPHTNAYVPLVFKTRVGAGQHHFPIFQRTILRPGGITISRPSD